jgi:hypothetical protein
MLDGPDEWPSERDSKSGDDDDQRPYEAPEEGRDFEFPDDEPTSDSSSEGDSDPGDDPLRVSPSLGGCLPRVRMTRTTFTLARVASATQRR